MSSYTTQVRCICEELSGVEYGNYKDVELAIQGSVDKIFDFPIEFWNSEYRKPFLIKFLKHFYTREICCETYSRWKLMLEDKFNLIMPYYNKLYESEEMKYDPLNDMAVKITHDGENTNHDVSSDTSSTRDRYSDTPQGTLQNIEDDTYLTNARIIDGGGRTERDGNGTLNYVETRTGKVSGNTYAAMMKEYRDNLLRIDERLMNEFEPLFFGLW